MPAPRAPGIGDSIEKWEAYIVKYVDYAKANELPRFASIEPTFERFKAKAIDQFGTNWASAVSSGKDKGFIKTMEHNWKYYAYLGLTGRNPASFGYKSYM